MFRYLHTLSAVCTALLASACITYRLPPASVAAPTAATPVVAAPPFPQAPQAAPTGVAFLPSIANSPDQPPARRVNAPYFANNTILEHEAGIFWLGKVNATDNYADVRVGYGDTGLFIKLLIFDRRLWYNPNPTPADLTAWDSATILIQTAGNTGDRPATTSYRLDAQLTDWETDRSQWQAAYQGNGTAWTASLVSFSTQTHYAWESPYVGGVNNNQNNRGWTLIYHIPFSSLGFAAPPAQGAVWGLGVQLHDRDDSAGTPITDKLWPENLTRDRPSSWGQLHFGLPTFNAPAVSTRTTITIQNGWQGAVVTDIGAGGTISRQCPGDPNFVWNQWGDANYAGAPNFLIQNQGDVTDWPCFAKAYINFPLDTIPKGKRIVSATLTLHEWGGSDPTQAWPSLVQLFTVRDNWNPATLTWNNAPLALENVSRAWVDVYSLIPPQWPGAAIVWDVSYALAQSYAANQPLRLAIYEADTAMHSGKYFTGSSEGDWNAAGRPMLTVIYGSP